jgi:hypothetical protein
MGSAHIIQRYYGANSRDQLCTIKKLGNRVQPFGSQLNITEYRATWATMNGNFPMNAILAHDDSPSGAKERTARCDRDL